VPPPPQSDHLYPPLQRGGPHCETPRHSLHLLQRGCPNQNHPSYHRSTGHHQCPPSSRFGWFAPTSAPRVTKLVLFSIWCLDVYLLVDMMHLVFIACTYRVGCQCCSTQQSNMWVFGLLYSIAFASHWFAILPWLPLPFAVVCSMS
jgi:hypothetical protein